MAAYSDFEFTQYAVAHENPQGPGDARPTALQIVQDNELEGKFDDKVVIITGCSSGIGITTAQAMKATGAHVFATARDVSKGHHALAGILEPGKLDLLPLDLSSRASIRKFVTHFLALSEGKLNILINNAGVMHTPEDRTEDGFETQFGTNHLGHFLLFQLLKPALLASSTRDLHSRVVNVSSTAHRTTTINFDNLMLDGEYDSGRAYGQSKLANIYMANEIERRYGPQGLHGLSCHPGGITTELQRNVPQLVEQWAKVPDVPENLKSPEQGAATTVWAAIGKVWEGRGGVYLEHCQVSPPVEEGYHFLDMGFEKWAFDEEAAEKLWEVSNQFVGYTEDE